ncbi:hypothetical protein FKW77_002593 [Venturia effusa]|uniref:Uncharacterized protein n=1 Tax=Venturia effusa TaxID=50376 RepID=A0A517LMD7_9PEZI|nr:hypothetical protein FKW77_002593 [Venturia effusa]
MTRAQSDIQTGFQLAIQGMLAAIGEEYHQLRTQVQSQADRMKHLEEENKTQAAHTERLQSQVQDLIEGSQQEPFQVQMHANFIEIMREVVSNVGKEMAGMFQQTTSHTQWATTRINELEARNDRLAEENNKSVTNYQRLLENIDAIKRQGETRDNDILRLSNEQERVGAECQMLTSELGDIWQEHDNLQKQSQRQTVCYEELEVKLKAL